MPLMRPHGCMVRLFLKNPLVILPDAIRQGRTMVIISHNLAQIVVCNCIYVMKKGEMVASGIHAGFYEKRGTYRGIFDASARSLNIEKLAKTMADDGDEVLDAAL